MRPMRRLAPLLALPLVLAGGAVAMGGVTSAATCRAGVHKFDKHALARTFCGPARAKVVLAPGKTVAFKPGNCQKDSKYLTINLGTIVLGSTHKKRPEYFGITVGRPPGSSGGKSARHDGTYHDAVIAFVHNNKDYGLRDTTLTLTHNRTRGTFSGAPFSGQGTISGSFRCK